MSRLPRISGKDAIRALAQAGYQVARIRGSHHVLVNPSGKTVVVPVHAGEILGPGLLRSILKDADLSVEEFERLL